MPLGQRAGYKSGCRYCGAQGEFEDDRTNVLSYNIHAVVGKGFKAMNIHFRTQQGHPNAKQWQFEVVQIYVHSTYAALNVIHTYGWSIWF